MDAFPKNANASSGEHGFWAMIVPTAMSTTVRDSIAAATSYRARWRRLILSADRWAFSA